MRTAVESKTKTQIAFLQLQFPSEARLMSHVATKGKIVHVLLTPEIMAREPKPLYSAVAFSKQSALFWTNCWPDSRYSRYSRHIALWRNMSVTNPPREVSQFFPPFGSQKEESLQPNVSSQKWLQKVSEKLLSGFMCKDQATRCTCKTLRLRLPDVQSTGLESAIEVSCLINFCTKVPLSSFFGKSSTFCKNKKNDKNQWGLS